MPGGAPHQQSFWRAGGGERASRPAARLRRTLPPLIPSAAPARPLGALAAGCQWGVRARSHPRCPQCCLHGEAAGRGERGGFNARAAHAQGCLACCCQERECTAVAFHRDGGPLQALALLTDSQHHAAPNVHEWPSSFTRRHAWVEGLPGVVSEPGGMLTGGVPVVTLPLGGAPAAGGVPVAAGGLGTLPVGAAAAGVGPGTAAGGAPVLAGGSRSKPPVEAGDGEAVFAGDGLVVV